MNKITLSTLTARKVKFIIKATIVLLEIHPKVFTQDIRVILHDLIVPLILNL